MMRSFISRSDKQYDCVKDIFEWYLFFEMAQAMCTIVLLTRHDNSSQVRQAKTRMEKQ